MLLSSSFIFRGRECALIGSDFRKSESLGPRHQEISVLSLYVAGTPHMHRIANLLDSTNEQSFILTTIVVIEQARTSESFLFTKVTKK